MFPLNNAKPIYAIITNKCQVGRVQGVVRVVCVVGGLEQKQKRTQQQLDVSSSAPQHSSSIALTATTAL